jgi:hypothetical protein
VESSARKGSTERMIAVGCSTYCTASDIFTSCLRVQSLNVLSQDIAVACAFCEPF